MQRKLCRKPIKYLSKKYFKKSNEIFLPSLLPDLKLMRAQRLRKDHNVFTTIESPLITAKMKYTRINYEVWAFVSILKNATAANQ